VVIAELSAVPGSKFRSVVAFLPLGNKGKRRENCVVSSRCLLMRGKCNLVVVETYETSVACCREGAKTSTACCVR
jgi:hypothetical protein